MKKERLNGILSHVSVSAGHPYFLTQLFTAVGRDLKDRARQRQRKLGKAENILIKEHDGFSRRLDSTGIQESCSVRNTLKSRRLAMLLIKQDGKLATDRLDQAIIALEKHKYPLGPNRHHDYRRNEHTGVVLQRLAESKKIQTLLHSISKPFSNPPADALIRDTLQLPEKTPITDVHARQAALAAWLCYLRQNVGSCFATAPSIIIHDDQPEQFLVDINDLLTTGRLTRTFGGTEYSAPLSGSWGAGDLKKPFVFHSDPDLSGTSVWEAPGVIIALTKVKVLDPDTSLSKRVKQCKKLLKKVYSNDSERTGPFYCSVEEIIRLLVMDHQEVTEQDIEEYETRPRAMIHSGLMIQTRGKGGQEKKILDFYSTLKAAAKAFKSLTDNALLKAWEFTVASFAEVKPTLARYNMYHSLGLGSQDKGGIGEALFKDLKEKVDNFNAETKEFQDIYEQMYLQVKHLEGRLRRASEDEAQYIKREYKGRIMQMEEQQRLRDEAHYKAERFANLFDVLITLYDTKFVEHFQEVYDPDIHEVTAGPYDDSPAGFRLLYKAGRTQSSQWERIDTPDQFTDALSGFFIATEREISYATECEGIEEDVSALITGIVSHVKTHEFLESAFDRMAVAHKAKPIRDPLNNLEKVPKKPWVYTSGGTMGSLVSAYFSREQKPTEQERWVENITELAAFIIDTIKQIPDNISQTLVDNPKRPLLIHSPTHAFLLKPGKTLLQQAWQNEEYTYTWIRERIESPGKGFVNGLRLDDSMIAKLLNLLRESLPKEYHHFFNKAFYRIPKTLNSTEFRRYVIKTVDRDRSLRRGKHSVIDEDDVDNLLYRQLPMVKGYGLRERVVDLFEEMPSIDKNMKEALIDIYDKVVGQIGREDVLGAEQFREVVQGLLMVHLCTTSTSEAYLREITDVMRRRGWMQPLPFVFADTNWVKDDFALLVNPGNGKLDLWRVDALALEGTPMSYWKQWVDGSRRDKKWGIYTNPFEYQS